MLEHNVIMTLGIGFVMVLIVRYLFPQLIGRGKLFEDVKTGLLLFGYAFRDDKLKAIATIIYRIVGEIERVYENKDNEVKRDEAIDLAMIEILDTFGISLERDVVQLIVNIAVAHLPRTH